MRVVVPFPPGGAPDLVGRTLANRLSERLGQPFVVENRTGAGGNIAAEAVAQSAPDGYTLFAPSDGPLVINPERLREVNFNPLKDFAPISLVASVGLALMACPSVQANTVEEVIALAKKRKVSYATSGFGSSQHMVGEMLKASADIDLVHVPYKGFGQAVTDAMSCNVDLIFGAISTGIPHVNSGKLKAIAVTIPRRHPGLPTTPTFREAGHPQVAIEAYMGLLAPAGTPQPIIEAPACRGGRDPEGEGNHRAPYRRRPRPRRQHARRIRRAPQGRPGEVRQDRALAGKRACSSRRSAQALHGLGLAADAQERALAVGALLQHLAAREDLAAQVLRRPGEEKLGLDQVALEERDDCLAQLGDVALAAARSSRCTPGYCARSAASRSPGGFVADAVDLVEDEEARHGLRADLVEHFLGHLELALEARDRSHR